MVYVNLLKSMFLLMTFSMTFMGISYNKFGKYLPTFMQQMILYGKFSYIGEKSPLELPKSWFKHFYVYSSILSLYGLMLMIYVLVLDYPVPTYVNNILDFLAGPERQNTTNVTEALIAMVLFTAQCVRRFYDTQFVSIFGKNSKFNLAHYTCGFVHYTGAVIAIIIEAPKFSGPTVFYSTLASTYVNIIGSVAFFWAWWHQHKATVILAELRKEKTGTIKNEEYKLPYGDWFDYVSSPHMLAEILMYGVLTIILWGNTTWLYIFLWVLSNQVEVCLINHWWYQSKFKELPKHRKAIIPFIY